MPIVSNLLKIKFVFLLFCWNIILPDMWLDYYGRYNRADDADRRFGSCSQYRGCLLYKVQHIVLIQYALGTYMRCINSAYLRPVGQADGGKQFHRQVSRHQRQPNTDNQQDKDCTVK